MKSLIALWETVALECATGCCTSTNRDIETVTVRSRHEGLSFLTITLPAFGKDFERSLELKRVDRSLFHAFRWKAGLPRFLGGFLDLVFDRETGVLLDEPNIEAIRSIRQLTLMFGKMKMPTSDRRRRAAMREFIQTDESVREHTEMLSGPSMEHHIHAFRRIKRLLFSKMFTKVDLAVYNHELRPKHGPGATADRRRGNAKWLQDTWTTRMEAVLPSGEYLLPSWSYYGQLEKLTYLEPGAELPVRVVDVPKTLKTPRIIAIEPTAMQYMQQALKDELVTGIEKGVGRQTYLHRFLGFEDQVPNQVLAQEGSLTGELATLDLSEASDRVSNYLVKILFAEHTWLSAAVQATRSTRANVDGEIIPLSKFASMGSALTFPVEAMVFLTIIFVGIEKELGRPLTHQDIKSMVGRVRVYGDDIIVPVDYVRSVVESLETFGARVNSNKSFWNGQFRESCGKEYFNGEDVSIVRVRETLPARRMHVRQIISTVSLRNQLYYAGYWQAVKMLDSRIRKILRYFPTVLPSSPALGRHSFLGYHADKPVWGRYQIPVVRAWVPRARTPESPLGDMGALNKFFRERGSDPMFDEDHLERAGRPLVVDIKLGYVSAV